MPAGTAITLQSIMASLLTNAPVLTIAFTTWLGVYTIKSGASDKQKERDRLELERQDRLRREQAQDLANATAATIENLRKDLEHCEQQREEIAKLLELEKLNRTRHPSVKRRR